jgi:beta-lactamase regulating signal transducer with metallopeptidase domain
VESVSSQSEPFGAVLTARANNTTRSWRLSESARRSLFVAGGIVGLLWLSVLLLSLFGVATHLLRISGLSSRAHETGGAELGRLTASLSGHLRIRPRVRTLVSDETSIPLTWGIRRPMIVLPVESLSWSEERLRAVLLHELAHVARRDYVVHMLVRIVEALYWPNPLTRLACSRIAEEREHACDDFVLRSGTGACEYAEHLVAVASSARREPKLAAVSLAMARRSTLATRVKGVLDGGRDRRPSSVTLFSFAILAVAFCSLTFGSLELVGVSSIERARAESLGRALADVDDADASVRRRAAWILGEVEACVAVDRLYSLLRDPDPGVRGTAAWALGEIKDPGSVDLLAESLHDPDLYVREIAALSLGEIENRAAVGYLEDAVEHREELLGPVLWALGEIGSRDANGARDRLLEARNLWRPWRNDEVWAGHLEEIELPSPSAINELIAGLSDPDPEIRRAAAQSLGCLDVYAAVNPLLDALRDPDATVRAMAVWALDEINPTSHS